jgi:hypothetical protein
MLRAHSLVPFKRILGMRDDEHEQIVKAAQGELSERGESARIYIKVSVLLKSSEQPFADYGPGMLYTDRGRRGHELQALHRVYHAESDKNRTSLWLAYSVYTFRLASTY